MAKDKGGHGSESRGGSALTASVSRGTPIAGIPASGGQPVASNEHAAATLASGPKSAPVATHDMMGRSQESIEGGEGQPTARNPHGIHMGYTKA
jgi:hypothetical protein